MQGAAAPAAPEKQGLTSLEALMSPARLEAARPHQGQTQEAPCGLPLKAQGLTKVPDAAPSLHSWPSGPSTLVSAL